MIRFNIRIKNARLENKMTQKQLAEQLTLKGFKVSNSAIANWESGLNQPDIDTLEAICKILHKDGNYFLDTQSNRCSDSNFETTKLITSYNQLNSVGKTKLIEFAKDLTKILEYTDKGRSVNNKEA